MRNFFKICIVLLALSGKMYSQNWLWVQSQGISGSYMSAGNVKRSSTGNLITYLADTNGTHLVFSNLNGFVLWSKFYQNLFVKDVCIDGSDNIYFSGNFNDTIDIQGYKYISKGYTDAIIGRFNGNGQFQQANVWGASLPESANSIVVSGGEIFVTGSFFQTVSVNSISLNGNSSTPNTFILKFDMNFSALAGNVTKSESCEGIKIAVDNTNSVYILGNSSSTLSIGTQSVDIIDGGQYLAKLNSNLNLTWLKTVNTHFMNGSYTPYIYFDVSGNILLGHITGGGGGSYREVEIEKFDQALNIIWTKRVDVNYGNYIDIDNMDNIWVAGNFTDFNTYTDFSIVKVSPAGLVTQLIYDKNIKHLVRGFTVKANNDFYITGICDGSSTLNGYGCSTNGSVFMARYGSLPAGIEKLSLNNSVSIYPNPATGMITISCNSGIKSACTLIIKNALGQLVYLDPLKETSGSFIKEVDLGFAPRGAYFVEVESNYERTSKTVILH